MLYLTNPVRHYDWGSATIIPDLLGISPDGSPHAELWMGAHPDDPSHVLVRGRDRRLDELIADDPEWVLGPSDSKRFAGRLPFLLKVLAVEAPLSLQVHPDAGRARRRYDEEAASGFPEAERAYRDPFPKPELICALTDFHVLCGFRPPEESAALLVGLVDAQLPWLIEALRAGAPGDSLRRVVERLLTLDAADASTAVAALGAACEERLTAGSPCEDLDRTVAELASRYPGDRGVLVAALMHRRTLRAGQAAFLDAGVAHAYLHGVGVEVLAASDNVVRGGLTSKRVDIPELLEVLNVGPQPDPVMDPVSTDGNRWSYPVPVESFSLERLSTTAGMTQHVPGGRARLLFVAEGEVVARVGNEQVVVGRGQSVLVTAAEPDAYLTGAGLVFVAAPGHTQR